MVQGFDQISCLYAFKRKICLWHTITPPHMISPVFVTVQDWTTTFWSQMASTFVSLDLGRTPEEPQAGSEDVSLLHFGGWIGRDAETNADGEQKENSTPKWKKSMKRGVFFSYPHSVVKKKKKSNTLYLCTSTYFWQFNLTSSYASYDIWEKNKPLVGVQAAWMEDKYF